MNNPLVVLLASGASNRFWPLEDKTLLKFCGKTLFEHQIKLLKDCGLTDVLVIASEGNLEKFKELKPDLKYVVQTTPKGMAGALLDSSDVWSGREIVVVSCNDVIEKSGIEALMKIEGDGAILAQKVKKYFPGGYLSVEGDRITGIVEKPGEGNEPSDLVNLVFHYHADTTALLEELHNAESSEDDIYEVALASLFAKKNYVAASYEGYWQAMKYPWHALELNKYFLSKVVQFVHTNAQIAKSAVISGEVYVGENVKIFHNAVIQGPAYLGDHCIVGNNALVRESSLEDKCVVGYNTEVARSLWQSGVQTHINYTGDSVLMDNVSLGAGAITANYRLDGKAVNSTIKDEKISTHEAKFGAAIGKNVHVGVHCTLLPGVKIGSDSMIASHIMVGEDIEEKRFVYLKDGEMIDVPNKKFN